MVSVSGIYPWFSCFRSPALPVIAYHAVRVVVEFLGAAWDLLCVDTAQPLLEEQETGRSTAL